MLIHPIVKQGADTTEVYIAETEVCPRLFWLTRLIMITLITRHTKEKDGIQFLHRWIKPLFLFVEEVLFHEKIV